MAKLLAWVRTIIAKIRTTPAQVVKCALACSALWKWAAGVVVVAVVAFVLYQNKDQFKTLMAWEGYDVLRDLMIAIVAIAGLVIAAKRLSALDSQAKTAEKRLLNEQFANAVELMAKETTGNNPKPAIAARTGGIYILADLATKKPKEFAEQVVKNLIAYIKENAQITAQPSPEEYQATGKKEPRTLGGDVKAAFSVLDDILRNKAMGIDKRVLDFSYQDFSGLDLLGIAMHHYKKWTRTDFRHCRLDGAHFQDADMRGVDFSNADLREATLENVVIKFAVMKEAKLIDAVMPKINLSLIDLRGANLLRANMQGANLFRAKMHGTMMHGVNLSKIDDGTPANLSFANFSGANMTRAKLQGANMQRANLWGVDLTSAVLHNANLADAYFGGTCLANIKIGKNKLTENVKSAMNNQVIHNGHKALAGEVGEMGDNFDWRLNYYPSSYALNGVLNNYAGAFSNDVPGRLALRIQAWEIRDNEKMPEKWREWLKGIDIETGEHPDDNPELDDIEF